MRLKKQGQTQRALEAYASLVAATESMRGTLEGQLSSYGLTMSRFRVLVALMQSGPMVQSDLIVAALRGDFSNGALVLKNLARDGLLKSVPHERDKRKVVIHLTAEGKARIAEVYPHHGNLVRAHMAALLSREQELLTRLCKKLHACDPVRFVHELTAVREER